MATAFQPNAFQQDAFQEHGGLTDTTVTIGINATQDGDTGSLVVHVVGADVTGGWPVVYPRRKRKRAEELADTAEAPTVEALAAAAVELAQRQAVRKAEQRDRRITSQLKAIYAEQDALTAAVDRAVTTLAEQSQDDDDLVLILSLAS